MSKSYTQALCDNLANISYKDLPRDVIDQVKRITCHVIGVAIASAPMNTTKNAKYLAERRGGIPEATIWGGKGAKIPAELAAFANATQADALDWEDCSWTGHPSAGAVSAAFAVAEARGLSGADYITAVATAYEGYQRIAMAVQPSHERVKAHGWGISSWQIFASTFAAAKLLGFDADRFNQAIGATIYATPGATSLHSQPGVKSNIYHFAHGTDAYSGIFAALITEAGFENGRDFLDGQKGYWSIVSDRHDPSWYAAREQGNWLIRETYIKHWPANMWVQTPLELLDHVWRQRPFTADEVVSIKLTPVSTLTATDYKESTRSTLDAQFNAGFCLASYILDPTPSSAWFAEDRLNDARVIELASKVAQSGDPHTPQDNFDIFKSKSFPTTSIRVELSDGTILEHEMTYPKGHPKNNTTLEEEYELFRTITVPFIGEEKAEAFIEGIKNLENLETLEPLAAQVSMA